MIVMLLAAVGLYAVVALSVSQRRREIGIRITVGARPQQVVTMFLVRGIKLSMIGLAIGLPIGIAALYAFSLQMQNIPTASYVPVAIVVCAVVLLAAGIASWLPARRAARVSPMVALQST